MKSVLFILVSVVFFTAGCKEEEPPTTPQETDKPVVEILEPENNSVINESVLIKVEASDDKGIVKLLIFIDNKTDSNRTFFVKPYEFLWRLPQEPDSTMHKIYVKAYDGDDNMTSSNVITVYHVSIERPSDLNIESISKTSFKLTWRDNSNDENGFLIERKTNYGAFNLFAEVGENDTSFIDESVSNYFTYGYRIKSFSDRDTSGYSDTIFAQYKRLYVPTEEIYSTPANGNVNTPSAIVPMSNQLIYSFQNENVFYFRQIDNPTATSFSLSNEEDKITMIVPDSEGKVLFGTTTGNIYLAELSSGFANPRIFYTGDEITDLVFLSNYNYFAAALRNGEIKIFDYEQNEEIASYRDSLNIGMISLAYNPIDNILYSGSDSGYLLEWDILQNQVVERTNFTFSIGAMAFNPIVQKLYMGLENGTVRILKTRNHQLSQGIQGAHYSLITEMKVNVSDSSLITTSNDGYVKLWNYRRENISAINLGQLNTAISASGINGYEYVVTGSQNVITIWKKDFRWYKL